ncbi:FHF complex subunit HOOK interacting protein 2A isoform X1 [Plutella xylostella]|uniref:FHF complex subunit HOOK interacting protein 2A isoform X1 n=1 Tax=Plutella xylostella TaxID=51655 RepID=UPI0020326AAA|nr:FHF complex subunit HOOK interacting protein 2A isoform X1 [Plutella xylostella]
MLSRFSDVLQTAADVLAPPATRLEDFEYHWKLILNFYQNYDQNCKERVEETRIPHHLNEMLQLIVDEEKEQQGGTVGPCLEAIIQRRVCLLDALTALAASDRPPGARALALSTGTALLRRTRQPCVNSAHVYRPLQRMLIQCSESPASPTEKDEVELLLTICGLVRKEPGLANIFTTPFVEDRTSLLSIPEDILKLIPIKAKVQTPKKNPLFEVELPPNPLANVSIIRTNRKDSYCNATESSSAGDDNVSCKSNKTVYDDNDKFLLIDLLLSYLNSADNQVVLRACEGIMIVFSLPCDDIAHLVSGCSAACEALVEQLAARFKCVPANIDAGCVDTRYSTWGYVPQDFGEKAYNKFLGYRELTSFFSWLDYCDTLMKECHPIIATHLARIFRQNFLEATVECGLTDLHHTVVVTAIVSKCLKVIDSQELINEFSNWLVGDGEVCEWPILHKLINNCLTNCHELTLETLKFFETIIERPTEHSIQKLVLSRLCTRGYYSPQTDARSDDDERDRLNDVSLWQERERNREAMKQLQHEDHVNEQISDILSHEGVAGARGGDNIHRVINSFLLLLPRAILSDPVGADYEQYIHDAHRHYQVWLDLTSTFSTNWIDTTAGSTHSYDSRPEADIHLDEVFEKPVNTGHPNTIREKSFAAQTFDSQCCTEEDVKSNKIGKCNKPASECFSQRLVLRSNSRDLTSTPDEEEFDEGPFLRMLFKLLANMTMQPYQVNLHVTCIISKLALMPHPHLHEYLLNPMLPTAKKTQTLFKTLQEVAKRLTMEIPRLRNYKKLIENTRMQLMSEDPAYDESGDHNQLVESLIVLEEFCKELAAIAFVKYQHSILCR